MLAISFALLSILILYVQYFADGRNFDLFNPKNLFQIYFIVQLPLVLVIGTNMDFTGFLALSENTDLNDIAELGLIFTIAHLAMVMAYYSFGKKYLSIAIVDTVKWRHARVRLICLFLVIIGYLAFYYLLQINGGYASFIEIREAWRAGGMTGQGWLIFPATSMLSIAAIAYLIVSAQKFKNKSGLLRFFLLCVLVVFPASQLGFRGLMLLPIVQLMFVYHHRVRSINFRAALPAMVVLVILFTVYGIYREIGYIFEGGIDLAIATKAIIDRPELIFAMLVRSKGADIVASVIQQLDDWSFKLFYPSIIESLTIFIPSGLWSGKPVPLSVQFSERFFGIGGGVSPTVVGEAYWHGGYVGVVLVMMIVGMLFRVFQNTVRNKSNNDSALFMLTAIFPSLIMMAEAIQGYLNGIVLMLILCFILIFSFSVSLLKSRHISHILLAPSR
jgi:oligosaccharide repeat unit polymerase